jgi:hypothetical protein
VLLNLLLEETACGDTGDARLVARWETSSLRAALGTVLLLLLLLFLLGGYADLVGGRRSCPDVGADQQPSWCTLSVLAARVDCQGAT